MMTNMAGKKDTGGKPQEGGRTLWNATAGGSSYAGVGAPAQLTDKVRAVATEVKREADERVRAYQTPVTAETLRTPAA